MPHQRNVHSECRTPSPRNRSPDSPHAPPEPLSSGHSTGRCSSRLSFSSDLGSTCFTGSYDSPERPVKRAECVRVSPATMDWLTEDREWYVHPYWEQVTHIVLVDWLVIDSTARRIVFRRVTLDEILNTGFCRTAQALYYVPLIEVLVNRWPHLKLVWQIPDMSSPDLFRHQVMMYLTSAHDLIRKIKNSEALLLNVVSTLHMSTVRWTAWRMPNMTYWLEMSPSDLIQDVSRAYFYLRNNCSYVLVPSFGFFKYGPRLAVNRGGPMPLLAECDCSREDTQTLIESLAGSGGVVFGIPKNRMLLWFDTQALVYDTVPYNPKQAWNVREVPLSESRRWKSLLWAETASEGFMAGEEMYDAGQGSFKIVGTSTVTSMDDVRTLRAKFDLICASYDDDWKLGGYMVGLLHLDGRPHLAGSLLMMLQQMANF